MSINAVPLHGLRGATSANQIPFSLGVGESLQFKSATSRQPFTLKLRLPQLSVKVDISVSNGHIFVTNQRLLYVTENQGDVESFVFPFANIPATQFSHKVQSPWFGPNYWLFLFFSPSSAVCDGFPKGEWFEGSISFKDGGLFDFYAALDRVFNDAVQNPHVDDELPQYSA